MHKAHRLAKLYNGNMNDPMIKESVQRKTDDEVPDDNSSGKFGRKNLYGEDPARAAAASGVNREPVPFSLQHLQSAKEKMKHAAERFDEHTSARLKSFDSKEIYADDLQDLLFRIFLIKMSPPECSALVHEFDNDGSGSVDYGEFLTAFFRLAHEHKQDLTLEADYMSHKVRKRIAKEDAKVSERFAKSSVVKVPKNYTAKDLHSALDKVAMCSR